MNLNKKVICKDGFEMSVQANRMAYCHPRETGAESYDSVEVGYPKPHEEILARYAEISPQMDHSGVYPWVPAHVVTMICAKHGGVVEGELPAGIPYLRATA